MSHGPTARDDTPRPGFIGWWQRTPLYARIVGALLLGILTGVLLSEFGGANTPGIASGLKDVSGLVLALLRALATPLILLAILNAILRTRIGGAVARRMAFYLVTNTMAAICIGLLVANVIQPGHWKGDIGRPSAQEEQTVQEKKPYNALEDIKSKIPTNIVRPLYDDNVIAVIILGLTFGVALRKVRTDQQAEGKSEYRAVENFLSTSFAAVMTALHWIIQLVPLAVFCVVASVVASQGAAPFQKLFGFIVAVLIALALQVAFYLTRVRFGSWVSPRRFLSGGKDAFLTAFSTASSTVTMPITYNALRDRNKVGLREQSASMGALVGSNFNNDGTALYEAMAPLFIAQAIGTPLSLVQQIVIAFMAVVASVGAAGIPEAGLVTMLLVFKSVNLDTAYVLLILPVDWFLDRCRTTVNVMGDMTVACLLDGKTPMTDEEALAEQEGAGNSATDEGEENVSEMQESYADSEKTKEPA
jgi:Na+/H+-dicarboxylate symporter